MITNIRHTGIVVRNLEEALKFYEGLGLLMFKREIEEGPYIEKVVGLKNAIVETVKLKSPCGALLELLQYHSNHSDKKINRQKSNRLGCSHIAITVKNIDELLHYIVKNGGSMVNSPETSPDGDVQVAYCHDLEGNLIEVVEEK